MALLEYINATRDDDPSISGALTHLLDPSHIPQLPAAPSALGQDALNQVAAAKGAIFVLYTQCAYALLSTTTTTAATRTNNKAGLADLLEIHHTCLLQWGRFFLDPEAPPAVHALPPSAQQHDFVKDLAHLFLIMLGMSKSLGETLISSPSATSLFLHLWTMQNRQGEHFHAHGTDVCPMTYLVKCLFTHECGRLTILSLIQTTLPNLMEEVALSLRCRIQDVAKLSSGVQETYIMQRLDDLTFLASIILRHPDELLNPHLKPLQTPEFVSDMVKSVESALHLRQGMLSNDDVPDIIQFLSIVIFTNGSASASKNVQAALESGIYCLIIRAMRHIPSSAPSHTTLVNLLRKIAAYSVYPQVVCPLNDAIRDIPAATVLEASESNIFKESWGSICDWGAEIAQMEEVHDDYLCGWIQVS